MHYIFLYSRRSNDTLKKKYLGPMLCQTAFHFHSPSPCKAHDKLTQHKCFWIHLWPVSSKYSANIKSGPKNPLNKHNETPTASLCVLLLTYSGMFLCLWITNNKLQNICSEPFVWITVFQIASQLNTFTLVFYGNASDFWSHLSSVYKPAAYLSFL